MARMKTVLGDATSVTVGYTAVDPTSGIFDGLNSMLLNITNPSTSEELIRLIASLILTVLSRFVYAWIDKKFGKSKPEPIPLDNGKKEGQQESRDTQ